MATETKTFNSPIKRYRKGQFLFNFLEWLHIEKGIDTGQSHRLADPFFLENEEFDKLYNEYINELSE